MYVLCVYLFNEQVGYKILNNKTKKKQGVCGLYRVYTHIRISEKLFLIQLNKTKH